MGTILLMGGGPGRISAGASNPWDTISGCVLALSPDGPFYTTSGGATPSGIGDPVGQWNDLSGNGRHATQSSSSLRPTLQSDGLQFDMTDDYLTVSGVSVSQWTVYFAGKIPSNTARWYPLSMDPSAGGWNNINTRTKMGAYSSGGSGAEVSIPAQSGAALLVRMRQDGTNLPYLACTGQAEVQAASGQNTGVIAPNNVGAMATAGRQNDNAATRYAAVLAWNRVLTAGERATVETWFSGKGYAL